MRISLREGLSLRHPFPFVVFFKTWHADGTEFENAFVPPAGGNICYGVWKDLGKGTVKLHHIGLMFNRPAASRPSSPTTKRTRSRPTEKPIKECSISNSGLPAMDAVGVGKPIAEVKGTVAATRITVD